MDFSALDTYLSTKLINVFDADAYVFSDDGKTTPCADTDPVYRWGTSGGISSLDCYQATLAKQPLWYADYAGLGYPAILLDGTDDWMQIDSLADADYTDEFAVFVVGKTLAVATKTYAGRGVAGGGYQFAYWTSTTGTSSQIITSVANRGVATTRSVDTDNGVWGFGFSAGRSLATAGLSVQSLYNAGETATADTSNWYLGTYNGSGLLGNMAVRAFVLCKGLTAAEFSATANWLNTAYGYGETVTTAGASQTFHPLGGS